MGAVYQRRPLLGGGDRVHDDIVRPAQYPRHVVRASRAARRPTDCYPSPARGLPYLHISRFRLADSGETLDFGSFPALGDAQGEVWCKSLLRLIFRNLCRYRSASGERERTELAAPADSNPPEHALVLLSQKVAG